MYSGETVPPCPADRIYCVPFHVSRVLLSVFQRVSPIVGDGHLDASEPKGITMPPVIPDLKYPCPVGINSNPPFVVFVILPCLNLIKSITISPVPLGVKFTFVSVVVVVIVLVSKFISSTCNDVKLIPDASTEPDAVLPA